MKKFLSLLLATTLVGAMLVGCSDSNSQQNNNNNNNGGETQKLAYELVKKGETTDAPPEVKAAQKYKIGVTVPHLANPHFIGMAYGYLSEAENCGVEAIINEAGGYTKLPNQIQQFEDFLALPVDGICLVCVDGEGCSGLIDQANSAGIPVVNVNVMVANENVAVRVRSDDTAIGEMHAKFVEEKLGGKGKVLMLCGPAGTSWAVGRSDGFVAYMEKNCPDIEIVDRRWLDSDPAAGMQEMEDALQSYSDLDCVFTGSDMLGVGAANAVKAAGLAGKVIITTTDSQDACLDAIREGVITETVCQSSVLQGAWGMRALVNILEGKHDSLVSQYWTPLNMITKDNVDTFDYVGISKAPEGWTISGAH